MTDKTQPEALRLANVCSNLTRYSMDAHLIAAELRRQHARIAELDAELEAVGAGGVQALSAAPAGWKLVPVEPTNDMQKAADEWAAKGFDWPKAVYRAMLAASPTPPAEQQAEESCVKLLAECRDAFPIPEPSSPLEVQWTAAMARPEEVPEYVRLCVAAMQAAPKAAQGVGNSGFDHQTAADFLNGKTVSDESVRKFVQASRWAHDEKASLSAMLLSVRGELASRNAEIALLKRALMEAEAAPKAAPGDTDGYKQALGSNNCMQCCVSYMLGLPLADVPHFADGGGWDQFSSFVESKGYSAVMLPGVHEPEADYLASGRTERGTSHMVVMNDGKLVFDPHPSNAGLSFVQCVWLLAKRAAPQQQAQEPWGACVSGRVFAGGLPEHARKLAEAENLPIQWLYRAPQPAPAPLSDDVVRDAARYQWLRENWFTMTSNYQRCITFKVGEPRWSDITEEELDAAIDAALAAQGGE